ncbi:MAG: acyl-[acyl-carrier-protein] thioesterase [Acidimicrobiia bacterium]
MSEAADPSPSALVARPGVGRVFEEARRVRLADVSPGGRLRLDAATRYLQDLSADDTADAALADAESWVVRKTVIEVRTFPRYLEALELATWCSGIGSHYAERRISIVGERGGAIEAATTWVHVDQGSGRPKRVPDGFADLYGEAAAGRRIKARLSHDPLPPGGELERAPWPLRFTDFDVLQHVNNAAYWEAVEETLADRRDLRAPLRAELEHRSAVERHATVERCHRSEPDGTLRVWLVADGSVAASAVLVAT